MLDIFSNLAMGFGNLFDITLILLCAAGVVIGILGGAIPGISPSMAVALMLPLTFKMDATTGIVMLMGIYTGANYGGAITAVAINTPGTPSSAVTSFDGYPLCQSGRAGEAMGISLWASVTGGIVSTLILIFFAEPLSVLTKQFWPSEYFALAFMGLTTVATLGGKHWRKALVAVLFGLLINTMGGDPTYGIDRYTFGSIALYDGIPMIPVLIGLFALGEVFSNLEKYDYSQQKFAKVDYKWPSFKYIWNLKWSMIRASVIGCIIGIFPGAGGTIAAFLAYDVEKRCSKTPELFGTGVPQGVCAGEAADNGSIGGSMIPLLTMGIPGSATAAVLLGALMIHDITPGPELFDKQSELVYTLFASMFLANAMMGIIGVYGSKIFARICDLSKTILYPLIIAFSILGSYAVEKNVVHVIICLVFGLIGWMMKKYKYPAAPVVLGVVLGRMMELNFTQALMVGGWSTFLRPFTLILFAISLAAIIWPIISDRRAAKGKGDSRAILADDED